MTIWRKEKGERRKGNGEWGMENRCAMVLHSPFSILYSPVLSIKLIMARVLHHFNVSAQQSIYHRDEDGKQHGRPKAFDHETIHELIGNHENGGIDDQQKQAQRENGCRNRKHYEQWLEECVEQGKNNSSYNGNPRLFKPDAVHEVIGNEQCHGGTDQLQQGSFELVLTAHGAKVTRLPSSATALVQ